jgi:methionyl-tRNA formyltransferase
VKLWQARVVALAAPAVAGTVVQASSEGLIIACGQDALQVVQVQRPGGKRQPVSALLQARPATVGQVLGSAV